MSKWRFILTDRDNNDHIVNEPINWVNPEIKISRETQQGWHGIFFDYGVEKLTFDGIGASIIKNEYDLNGVNGQILLNIEYQCSEDNKYDSFYRNGQLAFDEYEYTCGDECTVTIGVQDSDDIMLFKNNYEQDVDLNKNISFDQETILTEYDYLNIPITLPGRGLPQTVSGKSPGANHNTYPIDFSVITPLTRLLIRPELTLSPVSEVIDSDAVGTSSWALPAQITPAIYPEEVSHLIDLKNIVGCSNGVFDYTGRIKGELDFEFNRRIATLEMYVAITTKRAYADSTDDAIFSQSFYSATNINPTTIFNIPFDIMNEGSVALQVGDVLDVYIRIDVSLSNAIPPGEYLTEKTYVRWSPETAFKVSTLSNCPPSEAKIYLINESISRAVESITNGRIRFYSETFGRTDSQPYSIGVNTCAGLMGISNGLNVRRKLLQNNEQPGFFINMKKIFSGLNSIWNIGLTVEPDLFRPGFKYLRMEKWSYFYQNEIGATFRYATKVSGKVDTSRIFNKITVGYNKWEAEGSTGLYELMTTRTYRLNINSVAKELNITSDFICSPYTIEITRRLDESTQDWKYDNDIFALCLKGAPYSVETFLDSATSISNVVDPNTAYNGRITPVRNLMRWFNYIMQAFRQLKVDSKLIFSSGTGNYIARLKMNNCAIEGKTMAENEDIDLGDFNDIQDAKPITFPELVEFEHPMNYQTFKRFKDDPTLRYKSVEYYCNGTAFQGWIDEISYRPEEGMANITVIPKNNLQLPGPPDTACHATIVPGSLVITECGDNCRQFDFTEGNPGATFWYYLVTKGTVPAQGEGFSATTPEHPFTVDGLTPGDWSIYIVPYCDLENIGENYAAATFNIPLPAFSIELSAILTTGRQPYNKLQLTAQSNVAVSQGFQFKFGQCCTNTSTGVNTCSGFPGATIPPPQAPPGTMSFNTGDAQKMAESGYSTPGADFGTITKVVIYDLQGIEPSQITKAAGQTWALEFQ